MVWHLNRSGRRLQWVDGFAVLAIGLGLSGVFARITGVSFFTKLEWASAIAPNPSPYTQIDKIKPSDVFNGLQFACEEPSGELKWIPWDYHVRATIPGPHRRTIGILNFFGMAQRRNLNRVAKVHFRNMNNYYFCDNGPLAQDMNCSEDIKGVRFKWVETRGAKSFPVEVRHPCSI